MKKTITILMALMVLFFTQCKPTPEGGDENNRKVKVSCSIPINKGDKSDFTNIMENGKINWSDGEEYVYLAIPHSTQAQIIELRGYAYGESSSLEFEGEVPEGLLEEDGEYEVWYFGNSINTLYPYVNKNMSGDKIQKINGSISKQSGNIEDLGYHHIAKVKVKAVMEGDEIVLPLKGVMENCMAIAYLDLEGVANLNGDAIVGTEYSLQYNGSLGEYELAVTESSTANINVITGASKSYLVLLPNEEINTELRTVKADGSIYGVKFGSKIKANKLYYKTDGAYGKETLPWSEIPTINGHEYVDLGLPSGLLWATCNVGANSPEEYGDYFAWGETTTKSEYTEANSLTYGKSLNDISGNPQYDAATANWGGTWRMPTYAEQEELLNNCTWTWTTQNGVNGYNVEGPNGNSIFLPAAGYRDGSSLGSAGSSGYCWSSTPYESYAYGLGFYSDYQYMSIGSRYLGLSVRPVCGGNNAEPEEPETPETPDNNHEYVDLGLSVKWATCNVGANSPEAYGNYYAWGETEPAPNNNYSSSNCSTYGLSNSELQSQGYIDSKGNLTAKYDAATANWGGDWRMPTKAEQEELLNNCTWTWTTQKGVNGYKVVGSNGNSIFLPAAGYYYGSSLEFAGSVGFYWNSAPYESGSAYFLCFNSGNHEMYYDYRYNGQSVRPVLE